MVVVASIPYWLNIAYLNHTRQTPPHSAHHHPATKAITITPLKATMNRLNQGQTEKT